MNSKHYENINSSRYNESRKYMNGIIGLCNWNATTYVRSHYKFSPVLADRTINKIVNNTNFFDKIFYVVEPDNSDFSNGIWYESTTQTINHIHLLMNFTNEGKRIARNNGLDYIKKTISKTTGLYGKEIGTVEPVRSNKAIGNYFAKQMFKSDSHHNIVFNATATG